MAPSASKPVEMMGWFESRSLARKFMRQTSLPPDVMDLRRKCYLIEIHRQHDDRDVYLVEDQEAIARGASVRHPRGVS
jgi:hypothetical protein